MKRVLVSLAGAVLAACDYTVPLVAAPQIDIDRSGIGVWERSGGSARGERLLVLPLGEKEYLVSYPAGAGDAMYARGAFWQGAGTTLVQLEWIGTARGEPSDSERTYQYAAYELEDDVLRIRLLDPDVVDRDIDTPSQLAAAIESNPGDPDLFRAPMRFRRVSDAP